MTQRIAIYVREAMCCRRSVTEQEANARAAAVHLEAEVLGVWREAFRSARQRRSGLPTRARMLAAARTAGVGAVVVGDACALGRSLSDLVREIAELGRSGVVVLIAGDGDAPPEAMGAMALDAARVRFRHEAAVEARARAVELGQRLGRPRLSAERIARARGALAAGHGVRAAARIAGIGVASAARIKQTNTNPSDPQPG